MFSVSLEWLIAVITIVILLLGTGMRVFFQWRKSLLFFKDSNEKLNELDQKIEEALMQEQQVQPSFKQLKKKYKTYLQSKESEL